MKESKATKQYDSSDWMYAQEVRQERKASKMLRQQRMQRKGVWQAAD